MRGSAPKESEKQLKLVEQQVKHTEEQIEQTIGEDQEMTKHFRLLRSVPGIGLVTAAALILTTSTLPLLRTAVNMPPIVV